MVNASYAIWQATMNCQTFCFDCKIAIGVQQRLLQTKKKCCAFGLGGLEAISIGSNMQPHLWWLLQSKVKCHMLQQAVALLFYKTFVFGLANSYSNVFAQVLLGMFGVFWRVWGFYNCFNSVGVYCIVQVTSKVDMWEQLLQDCFGAG